MRVYYRNIGRIFERTLTPLYMRRWVDFHRRANHRRQFPHAETNVRQNPNSPALDNLRVPRFRHILRFFWSTIRPSAHRYRQCFD